MFCLALTDVASYGFCGDYADCAVEVSSTPEFLPPEFVDKKFFVMLSEGATRRTFESLRERGDSVTFPMRDEQVHMVRTII